MYKLPKETGQKVLDYLSQQPFKDVYLLIMELQNLDRCEDKKSIKDDSVKPSEETETILETPHKRCVSNKAENDKDSEPKDSK